MNSSAFVACWWEVRRKNAHWLSDVPVQMRIIVLNEAVVPVWRGTLSAEWSGHFSYPSGIAALPDGGFLVSEATSNRVSRVCGSSTSIVAEAGSTPGKVLRPMGLCVEDDHYFLVADSHNHRVQRLCVDSSGAVLVMGAGVLRSPTAVAVGKDGGVFVADEAAHCIAVFSHDGTYLRFFGLRGAGDGQFDFPRGVAVTSSGDIAVAEWGNSRVQIVTADGTFRRSLLSKQLRRPFGVAVDGNDNLIVADSDQHRVLIAALGSGSILDSIGGVGEELGELKHPLAACVLYDGTLAVADTLNNRVQIV